jgi:hypothetical protein
VFVQGTPTPAEPGTTAGAIRNEGVRVLRDSAWILTGVMLGTTVSTGLIPATLTIDAGTAVSVASMAAFTMLLSSLCDPSDR